MRFPISLIGLWIILIIALGLGWANLNLAYGSVQHYDFCRQLEVLWLLLNAVVVTWGLLRGSIRFGRHSAIFLLFSALIWILASWSMYRAPYAWAAQRDFALQWLWLIGGYFHLVFVRQYLLDRPAFPQKQSGKLTLPHLFFGATWLPLMTLVWLIVSLYQLNIEMEWHGGFANIRMLDDALLPFLWLLWLQPGRSSRWTYQASILILGAFYSLALWLDGARAVLFASFLGLSLATILALIQRDRQAMPSISVAWAGLIGGLGLNWLIQTLLVQSGHPVLRAGSSGRVELWQLSLQHWQSQPWLGVGGDHFGRLADAARSMHPHNLPLQWLGEWGIAGLLALLLLAAGMVRLGQRLYRRQQWLGVGAIIAVAINLGLSGMGVYPVSHLGLMLLAIFLVLKAYSTVEVPTSIQPSPTAQSQDLKASRFDSFYQRMTAGIFAASILLAALILLSGVGSDLFSTGQSIDDQNAPRFWQYGRARHLALEEITP